jgi:uracil-DNA glycosylase
MESGNGDQRRAAVARMLETDYLLGVRHVPLVASLKPAVPPRPATSAAAPARCAVPANEARVLRLDMPADDYADRQQRIRQLVQQVAVCRKCRLAETRTKVVPGQGDVRTRLVFVGEAPGADEDRQGLAFVGRAGQLLTDMIAAMGLSREWVYICNILKCRPPENRPPAPDEIADCWPFLDEQLRIIQPDLIVALGKPASQTLLRTDESIGRLRGVWREYYPSGVAGVGESIPLMPTYHPSYLLRSPGEKGKAWSDLKQVMARLGLVAPGA